MSSADTRTVIGRATRWRGELECAESLQIDGTFEGTILQRNGQLTIGSEAHVRASVKAENAFIFGRVEGDIHATGHVALKANSEVIGNIYSARFSMEDSAVLRGRVGPPASNSEPADTVVAVPAMRAEPAAEATHISFAAGPAALLTAADEIDHQENLQNSTLGSSERQTFVPAPMTQSGRQLPSALAAFAAGGRQNSGKSVERQNPRAAENTRWRSHDHKE